MNRLHAPHGLNGLHTSTRPAYAGHTSATAYATRLDLNTTNRPATRAWAGQGHAMSEHLPSRQFLRAGEELDAWRVLSVPHVVLSGVAISRRLIDEPEDLQLLQPGDLVGLETFQRRLSERSIQALIDCELAPLRRMSDAEWRELLLHALLRRHPDARWLRRSLTRSRSTASSSTSTPTRSRKACTIILMWMQS